VAQLVHALNVFDFMVPVTSFNNTAMRRNGEVFSMLRKGGMQLMKCGTLLLVYEEIPGAYTHDYLYT